MNDTRTIKLRGEGVVLGLEEYGDPQGEPVFFFHGWPSSRLQGVMADKPGRELGMRVLSLDRPGLGASAHMENRRLIDWPDLLTEVADRLGFDKFLVLGVSGGGPYALASAWKLPGRIRAAAVVCGAPPIAELADSKRLFPIYRILLAIYRRYPNSLRGLFRIARPFAMIEPPEWMWPLILRVLPGSDREIFREPEVRKAGFRSYLGSWHGHPDGVFSDARIYAEPWGFPVEEIRAPVTFWHGADDANFHWSLAESLAKRIPAAEWHLVQGEGHYSIAFRRMGEIMQNLQRIAQGRGRSLVQV